VWSLQRTQGWIARIWTSHRKERQKPVGDGFRRKVTAAVMSNPSLVLDPFRCRFSGRDAAVRTIRDGAPANVWAATGVCLAFSARLVRTFLFGIDDRADG
jgi:hypothetical protein